MRRGLGWGRDFPWEILPLGEHSDAAIAEEIGVSRATVRRARVRLGIPAFGRASWADRLRRQAQEGEKERGDPRDEESNANLIKLDEVVTGLGDPYVDHFPVPPGKRIRLITRERPGFKPEWTRVDYVLANDCVNYLDIKGQLLLIPIGEKPVGAKLGPTFWGKQLDVPLPKCRGTPLLIGSLERVAIDLEQTGPNNLNSAHVVLHAASRDIGRRIEGVERDAETLGEVLYRDLAAHLGVSPSCVRRGIAPVGNGGRS